jgi:tetratricopeptide (TPR) repeat protein
VLIAAERDREAAEHVRAALPVLEQHLGADHGQVANAYNVLAEALYNRGDLDGAIAAYEIARDRMTRSSLDPSYLASAEWGLARALERRDPARARTLAEQAVARWKDGPPSWAEPRAQAEAWLRKHPR